MKKMFLFAAVLSMFFILSCGEESDNEKDDAANTGNTTTDSSNPGSQTDGSNEKPDENNQENNNCTKNADCSNDNVCDSTSKECVSPFGKAWKITVVSAKFAEKKDDGTDWDVPGGLPDPVVSLYHNDTENPFFATSEKEDTLTPAWNESTTVTLNKFDKFYVGVWDIDLSEDDLAADWQISMDNAAFFKNGGISIKETKQVREVVIKAVQAW